MTDEELIKDFQAFLPQNNTKRANGMILIPVIIEDAKRALLANAQFSALCLTFALVDECATFEWNKSHSNHNNEKAYAHWFNMWDSSEGIDDENLKKEMETFECKMKNNHSGSPYLDGQLLYKIRCSILHAVFTNIDFMNCGLGNNANKNIKKFALVLSKPNQFLMGCGISSNSDKDNNNSINIDVQSLVEKLLYLVGLYYDRNKKIIEFNTIKVIDYTGDYIPDKSNQ